MEQSQAIIVKLSPCTKQQHDCKFMIKFQKTVAFGKFGASDFTISKDSERRDLYIKRHEKLESKFWEFKPENYLTRSFWSRWLLWEKEDIYDAIKHIEANTNLKIQLTKNTIDKHHRLLSKLAK